MAEILIVDDDPIFCRVLFAVLKNAGHQVAHARSLNEGMERFLSGSFDLVFLDVELPDGNGLDIVPKLREASFQPEIIIITAYGDEKGAELAIRSGAWDYILKPVSPQKVALNLSRVLQYREEKKRRVELSLKRTNIIGKSTAIKNALELVVQAAGSSASVLVMGETGTGKELFARAIHENSVRAGSSFVVVDCGSLHETLAEGILFGHEKGAFTGADRSRDGVIRIADKGTLFLDEVAELPLSLQKLLLRVLQERRFRPLGSKKEIESDFRLVAATNQDIDLLVENGRFRKDLLYRLSGFTINLPSLRDRKEDIKNLAIHYLDDLYNRYRVKPKEVPEEFFDVLALYDWPGNVRELVNVMETTLAAARGDSVLLPRHLPDHLRIHAVCRSVRETVSFSPVAPSEEMEAALNDLPDQEIRPFSEVRRELLDNWERDYLTRLMSSAGNIPEACKISRLSRTRIYDLLKKYGLLKKQFELLCQNNSEQV